MKKIKFAILSLAVLASAAVFATSKSAGNQLFFAVADQSAVPAPGTVDVDTQLNAPGTCGNGITKICEIRTTPDAPTFTAGDLIPQEYVESYVTRYQ